MKTREQYVVFSFNASNAISRGLHSAFLSLSLSLSPFCIVCVCKCIFLSVRLTAYLPASFPLRFLSVPSRPSCRPADWQLTRQESGRQRSRRTPDIQAVLPFLVLLPCGIRRGRRCSGPTPRATATDSCHCFLTAAIQSPSLRPMPDATRPPTASCGQAIVLGRPGLAACGPSASPDLYRPCSSLKHKETGRDRERVAEVTAAKEPSELPEDPMTERAAMQPASPGPAGGNTALPDLAMASETFVFAGQHGQHCTVCGCPAPELLHIQFQFIPRSQSRSHFCIPPWNIKTDRNCSTLYYINRCSIQHLTTWAVSVFTPQLPLPPSFLLPNTSPRTH